MPCRRALKHPCALRRRAIKARPKTPSAACQVRGVGPRRLAAERSPDQNPATASPPLHGGQDRTHTSNRGDVAF